MANQSTRFLTREQPFGGVPQRNPNRRLLLHAKDFADVDQGNPIPLAYGTTRITGVDITPVFNIKQKGSSSK
jgi:hypothetical protein